MKQRIVLLAGSIAVGALAMPVWAAASSALSMPFAPSTPSTPPDAPPGACSSVPDGIGLVVPIEGGLGVARADGVEPIAGTLAGQPRVAVRGPDGTVWAQVPTVADTFDIVRTNPGGASTTVSSGEVTLMSAGWFDNRTAAVLIDGDQTNVRPDDVDAYGAVILDFADGSQLDLKAAGGPEYFAASVTLGSGRLVEGAVVDLAETFSYYLEVSTLLNDWVDPAGTAEYAAPPAYQWPIAADAAEDEAGVVLSWVEGPDLDQTSGELVGEWTLVTANPVSGEEVARVVLPDASALLHADFNGRFWVGTFADTPIAPDTSPMPERVVVVDLAATELTAVDAGCPAGTIATIDHNGDSVPLSGDATAPPETPPAPTTPAPTTPAPTTTTVTPATTAPAANAICPSYTENPRSYPVKLCQRGLPVMNVQIRLVEIGYEVDVDGFFGPETRDAVRAFQRDADLEVDGLVGTATWAALNAGNGAGTDADASGVIDPWEIPAQGDAPGGGSVADYIGTVYETSPPDFEVVTPEGPLPNLNFRGGWIVGDVGGGYGVDHFVDGVRHMLWFSRSPGYNPDGTPQPAVVIDAIEIPTPVGNEALTPTCELDGAFPTGGAQSVAAIVVDEGPGPYPAVRGAWFFDVTTEAIVAVDLSRVRCDVEGD